MRIPISKEIHSHTRKFQYAVIGGNIKMPRRSVFFASICQSGSLSVRPSVFLFDDGLREQTWQPASDQSKF